MIQPHRLACVTVFAAAGFMAAALAAGVPVPARVSSSVRPKTPADPAPAAGIDQFPKAAASYLVTLDGVVLWERASDVPRAPGSLAKIMAALVLLEGDWRGDAVVTVSARAASAEGARVGLRAGDRVRAEALLTAMLVRSANDACLALAERAGGNVDTFVARMNARAVEMKLRATRFADPTGLDAKGQASSARDLLRLTEAALKQPVFARLTALKEATIVTESGRSLPVETTNVLLGRLPGAKGVKTGFTAKAGKCLVALAERDGHRVLAVLLDSPDRWWAASAMIEEAFRAAGKAR